jgi:hypothetical protein
VYIYVYMHTYTDVITIDDDEPLPQKQRYARGTKVKMCLQGGERHGTIIRFDNMKQKKPKKRPTNMALSSGLMPGPSRSILCSLRMARNMSRTSQAIQT